MLDLQFHQPKDWTERYRFITQDKDKKGNPIMRFRLIPVANSKYMPHQGKKEQARRLRQRDR